MKKTKKILALLLALALCVCVFSACDSDPKSLIYDEIDEDDVRDVAEEYLDNILEENFYIVSCATVTRNPNGNMNQFISDFADEVVDIDNLPDSYVPDLKQFVMDDFTAEYNSNVSYEITDIEVDGDKATVKFNLTAPDLGYISMVPYAFDSYYYTTSTWEEQFYAAYYDVRGTDSIDTTTINCEMTIKANGDELEVTDIKCTSRTDI